jgi:hypothetical protein
MLPLYLLSLEIPFLFRRLFDDSLLVLDPEFVFDLLGCCEPTFYIIGEAIMVGRGKVSQSQTKLFKLISMNCFLF